MHVPGFFDFTGGDENSLPGGVATVEPGQDIQAAMDRMSAAGGGKVILAAGTHLISKPLLLKDNVILQGEERDRVLIRNTRTGGSESSQGALKIGIHHPAFNTPGKPTRYKRIAFGRVNTGDRVLTVTDWMGNRPKLGGLVMIMDQTYMETGRATPPARAHLWVQWVRITNLQNNQITIDEPIFHGYEAGFLDWPEDITDGSSGGLPIVFVENVILRDLSVCGGFEAERHGARNVLIENVRNIPRDAPYRNHGLMINGFYRSTLRTSTISYNLRAIELKGGSAMSVIANNTFNYVTPTPHMVGEAHDPILYYRPHWGTGEGAFALHFIGNQVSIPAFPDPRKQTPPFRFSQLGGSLVNNTFSLAHGHIGCAWVFLQGNGVQPAGGTTLSGNTYRVSAAQDYSCEGNACQGLIIEDEDWSDSTIAKRLR